MTAVRATWWLALVFHVAFIVAYFAGAAKVALVLAGIAVGSALISAVLLVREFRRHRAGSAGRTP